MPKSSQCADGTYVSVLLAAVLIVCVLWLCIAPASEQKEGYTLYESNAYNFGRCPMSYRIYDDANLQLPAGRNRCQSVCGRQDGEYDFAQYEYYCPHNCRQYGVSVCDQGKIM